MRGDRIQISDYELVVGQDEVCKHLCDREVDRKAVERAKELVRGGYVVEWWVSSVLPCVGEQSAIEGAEGQSTDQRCLE